MEMATRAGMSIQESTAAEFLVQGDEKMVMGMLWRIIVNQQISGVNVGKLRGKEGLLLWCKRRTADYSNVNVTNFTTSWSSGAAFLALIHSARPELIGDWNRLNTSDAAAGTNLKRAFEVAEKALGISPLLDVDDLLNVKSPDERSVMTYVSEFFTVMAASSERERAAKVVRATIEALNKR